MDKFFPSYQLFIQVDGGEVIYLPEEYAVDREFACKFVVNQTTTSTPQNATIKIYNLNDTNRKRIFFNWFDQASVCKIIGLYAGYKDEKYLIFKGVQQEVSSYREGASLVTEINATALGFASTGYSVNKEANNSYQYVSDDVGAFEDEEYVDPFYTDMKYDFVAGKSNRQILKNLVNEFCRFQRLNGMKCGYTIKISDMKWVKKRYYKPVTLTGNLFDMIKKYVPINTNVWMQDDMLYVISNDVALTRETNKTENRNKHQQNIDRYRRVKERNAKRIYKLELLASKEENQDVFIPNTSETITTENPEAISTTDTKDLENLIVINSDSGLLNTPRFYGQSMQLTTLFEPRVNCGDLIRLESDIQPEFNRDYKVCGVTHSCEMGFGTSGTNTTSLTLVYPNSNFADVGYPL